MTNDLTILASTRTVTFTPTGATITGACSFQEWWDAAWTLKQFQDKIETSIAWCWGDLLNEGESRYGESYSQAMELTGRDYQTVANWKWVSGKYPQKQRGLSGLRFKHYEKALRIKDPVERWNVLLYASENSIRGKAFDALLPTINETLPGTSDDQLFELQQANHQLQQENLANLARLAEYEQAGQELQAMLPSLPPEAARIVERAVSTFQRPATGQLFDLLNSLLDLWQIGRVSELNLILDELLRIRDGGQVSAQAENVLIVNVGERRLTIKR
jgi:hypothetical protein